MCARLLELLKDSLCQRAQQGQQQVYLQPSSLEALHRAFGASAALKAPPAKSPAAAKTPAGGSAAQAKEPNPVEPPAAAQHFRLPQQDSSSALGPLPQIQIPSGSKAEQLAALRAQVLRCTVSQKQLKRGKQLVFGVGNPEASLFFCGEAPGAEEEIQGEPFVGPAGQLLARIIKAMGLTREAVYISNIMSFRPPMPTPYGNRPPTPDELAFCLPYLCAQLQIVNPRVIVALGATAAKGLLGARAEAPMRELRGQWFPLENWALRVTYHPSYLLHNNSLSAKRAVWEDMMEVMVRLEMPISPTQRQFFQT